MLELFPGLLLQILLTSVAVLFALVLLLRPGIVRSRGGLVFGVVALVAIPLLALYVGAEQHVQHSKATSFCVSCHAMLPYGASLAKEDGSLAAAHFQHRRVPKEEACYTCHTQYTFFGGFQAKFAGVQHMWVNWVTTVPDPIELYQPYSNRECLHCHEGAPSFLEQPAHQGSIQEMEEEDLSCLLCHGPAHGVEEGEVRAAIDGEREFRMPREIDRKGAQWIR